MTVEEILKKKGGLFTTKIELADAFDKDDKDQAESRAMMIQTGGNSHYIVLREFNSAEMIDLQKKGKEDMAEELSGKLGDYIIEHSFAHENGKPAETSEVLEIIRGSSSLTVHVLEAWQSSLPLVKKTRKE